METSNSRNEGRMSELLDKLRSLLKDEPKLRCPDTDRFLAPFLRARKYDVDRALKLIKNYFHAKDRLTKLGSSSSILPSLHMACLRENYAILLRHGSLDPPGVPVLLFRVGRWDTSRYTLDSVFIATFLLLTQAIAEYERIQLCGVSVVVDLEGFGLSHARQCGLMQSKRIVQFIQDAFPLRVQSIHVLNHPPIFDLVFMMARQFMSEKMRKRYHFHGSDIGALKGHFGEKQLPLSLGGTMWEEECADTELVDKIVQNEDMYTQLQQSGFV